MPFFNFFQKKNTEKSFSITDLGIECDIHSHLLSALDDGAQSIKESITLVTELKNLGYKKLIITPHIMTGFYNNNATKINQSALLLREEIARKNIDILIDVAAEYYIDYDFTKDLSSKPMLCFGNKMLLFECSFVNEYKNLSETIFEMQINGYTPVLAHPERYTYWHKNIKVLQDLHERGVMMQVNITSLTNCCQYNVRKMAVEIINNGFCNFLGTDLHNSNQLECIKQLQINESIFDKLQKTNLLNNSLL